MKNNHKAYETSGVVISKKSPAVGDEILLTYSGLLAQSGADKIFAHIGYGDEWINKEFIPMDFNDGVFSAKIKITMPGKLFVSFKDSANNWDNNSFENYSFELKDKAKAVKAVKAEKETKPAKAKKTK